MKHRILFFSMSFLLSVQVAPAQTGYSTQKPWTYWWWMGSAVTKAGIQKQLQGFSDAGMGGVHIIPIYGVKGYEEQFLPFLSPQWLELVQFTIQQASALGLGVDLTLGTGWPFGGPWVDKKQAAKKLLIKEYPLGVTNHLKMDLNAIIEEEALLDLFAIVAVNEKGERIDLRLEIATKRIDRRVSEGNWTLTCFGTTNTLQKVKRAAPGGEGLVLDYFDRSGIEEYLQAFDSVFSNQRPTITPRAIYHDSYETYQADWTLGFMEKFKSRQGYDLTEVLPLFHSPSSPERAHILHDIRETLSDLLYTEFAKPWTDWSGQKGPLSRYQAHGSPGNILDLYALASIPETESFGCSNFHIPGLQCDKDYEEERFGRPSPLVMKFASSAAHLQNKALVSAETGTWLGNHFKVALSQVKPQVDELLVAGINHIFYHGTTYSPPEVPFPGWLFYASTNFGPLSHFWEELPLLNSYIAESQQILQNTTPDNDILLYFPIDDLWTKQEGNILLLLDVHKYKNWFSDTGFGETAKTLWENGFTFDYLSDRQLTQVNPMQEGNLFLGGEAAYSVIVVPPIDYIREATLLELSRLAEKGAKVIFAGEFPTHFSGFQAHRSRESGSISQVKAEILAKDGVKVSADLQGDLRALNIRQEGMKKQGLDFIRKRTATGYSYFITNLSDQFYEDSIRLSVDHQFLELFDPLRQKRGYLESNGSFFFQLPPGQSCFIRTDHTMPESAEWSYFAARDTLALDENWSVRFVSGNTDSLQASYTIPSLTSWTEWEDKHLQSFCGKAIYSRSFSIDDPEVGSNLYQLEFDQIHETAEVIINGTHCGTVWARPYQLNIPAHLLKQNNQIEIIVQNLSANLIKSIDSQGVPWKQFYDINFVDIQYQAFDASDWTYAPSGLIGKVILKSNKRLD